MAIREIWKIVIRTFGTLLILAAGISYAAEGMRPADFDFAEDKKRMDKLIQWPEIKGDISVVLNCFSQIESNGKMESTGCFLQNNYDEPFVGAIARAAKKARMNPAIIGGKERRIFLQFRVAFIAEGERREIHFYLNPGYEENVEAYGYDHVAGQRAIGKVEPWNEVCPKRAQYSVWVRAYLGEDGQADSPSIQHVDGIMPTATCQDAIKQTILSSQYTPALADGEPVPSTFVEFFGN
jgi:hypothetical protein